MGSLGFRKTGVDVIGEAPWGTHIAVLYSTKGDLLDVTAPYITQGLLNNELCIWLYSSNTSLEEIKETIRKYLTDVDEYLEAGKLRILSCAEWYMKDGRFNENITTEHLIGSAAGVFDHCLEGLRIAGDPSWLDKSDFQSFSHYEMNVNSFPSEIPFLALCLYDAHRTDISDFSEIINDHNYVLFWQGKALKLLKNVELTVNTEQPEHGKENYEKLLQLLPDAVFIHDKSRILYCNETAAQLLGANHSNDIIGKPILDFIADDKKSEYMDFMDKTLHKKGNLNFLQSKVSDINGNIIDIEATACRYACDYSQTILSVIRNISYSKRIAALKKDMKRGTELLNETLEYDKLKTEFFANMSHELRTPLNVILSAIQLMYAKKGSLLNPNGERYLKIMEQNCFRLLRLVNNLIDISKIESEFFELNLVNCNIVEIIENVTLSVSDYIKSKGLSIQFDTDTGEKIMACDPEQIERVILNLLSNAVKFTPSGGKVWVGINDCGNKIRIAVKDNGVGIPSEKQTVIFDRFRQVNKSLNRPQEGSGIGLSIVKLLVEKHGGKVMLDSKTGKGSEFILEIPCRVLPGAECSLPAEPASWEHNYAEKANIEFSDIYAS